MTYVPGTFEWALDMSYMKRAAGYIDAGRFDEAVETSTCT